MTKPLAERIAEDLFDWACKQRKEAITLQEFAQQRGIRPHLMYDWAKKFPILKKALQDAKIYVGNNREIGGLKRELSDRMVYGSMPIYSEEWKELIKWQHDIKKQQEEIRDLVIKLVDITSERKNEKLDRK